MLTEFLFPLWMEPASLTGNLRLSLCCPIQIQVQKLRVWPNSGFGQLWDRNEEMQVPWLCGMTTSPFTGGITTSLHRRATPLQRWISSESKSPGSIQATLKKNHSSGALVAHAFNSSTWKAKAGASLWVQGQLSHSYTVKFQTKRLKRRQPDIVDHTYNQPTAWVWSLSSYILSSRPSCFTYVCTRL